MLEWNPRLALLLVMMVGVALLLGSLVHLGTAGVDLQLVALVRSGVGRERSGRRLGAKPRSLEMRTCP